MTPTPAKREYAKPRLEVAKALHEVADARSEPEFRVAWEKCNPAYRTLLLRDAAAVLAKLKSLGFLSELAVTAIRAEEAGETKT